MGFQFALLATHIIQNVLIKRLKKKLNFGSSLFVQSATSLRSSSLFRYFQTVCVHIDQPLQK